ncbi:MAG: hypothetical protein KIS29_10970 [Thermoplasmata archaeon]|nr:hypothetical protein [Candidatus Sysuiplasma jiujiangense]
MTIAWTMPSITVEMPLANDENIEPKDPATPMPTGPSADESKTMAYTIAIMMTARII